MSGYLPSSKLLSSAFKVSTLSFLEWAIIAADTMSRIPKRIRTKAEQYSMFPDKGTTKPGYVNPRQQEVIRNTREPGSGRGHWIYELKCRECGHHYGANGNYIHSRKCPQCQGGQPG